MASKLINVHFSNIDCCLPADLSFATISITNLSSHGEAVRPRIVLADDFLGEESQIGWIRTSPGSQSLGEEWSGRDGRH